MAMILPADNVPLMVVEDGAVNFLSLYGGVLTLRILLSWFPQAQGVALLKPIFTVSDVYLNLFRGVIPSLGASSKEWQQKQPALRMPSMPSRAQMLSRARG